MELTPVHDAMVIIVPAFLISAGIMFYTAVQAAAVGIVRRRVPLYFAFALACLCAAVFQLATEAYYTAGSVTLAASALHWQLSAAFIFCPVFFAFTAWYTDQRRLTPWLTVVAALFALLLLDNLAQPYSVRFSSLEADGTLRLPWGESVPHFSGAPSAWDAITHLSILAIFIWAVARSVIQYRRGARLAALFLAGYLALQIMALLNSWLIDLGVIRSIYLGGFAFLSLAVLMSISLGLELQDRTVELETVGTELRTVVGRLRHSEEQLRRALEAGRVGIWEWDMTTNQVTWSDGVELIFGLTAGSFQGTFDAYRALVYPEDLKTLDRRLQLALEQHTPFSVEHRIRRPDGALRWLLGQGRVVRDTDGKPVRMLGTVLDITELKRAEESLRESEERFRRLAEGPFEGIGIADEGRILDANEQLGKILGYQQTELIGLPVAQLVAPESRELVMGKIHLADETPYEHLALRKDGSTFPVEVYGRRIPYKGRMVRVTAVRDITERKRVEASLRRAAEEVERLKDRLEAENIYLQDEIKVEHNFEEIIGVSPNFVAMLRQVEQVASTDSTVLILGETGTGKELIARAIHNISPRCARTLVKVNCASLPENLIESELFGHEKGAFTGALSRNIGRFELADGGTLFLDEIGELPLGLQAKLLRVLQEGEFERVGSSRTHRVDVRVIAATNRNLADAVDNGTFRNDLYYRLNVFPITVPPLRERRKDIPLLVKHFAAKFAGNSGKKIDQISKKSLELLGAYRWPGNIRELENIIERAVILNTGPTLEIGDPVEVGPAEPPRQDRATTLKEHEQMMIRKALEDCHWVIEGHAGAAARLDMPPSTLRDRMRKYCIEQSGRPS